MARAPRFYETLNQPPTGAHRHGKHRRPGKTAYRDSTDRAGDGARGTITFQSGTSLWSVSWSGDDASQDSGESARVGLVPGLVAAGHGLKVGNWSWVGAFDLDTESIKPLLTVLTTGELVGHRLWWLINGYLYSIAHEQRWEPGQVMEGDVDTWVCDGIEGGVYSNNDADFCYDQGVGFGKMLDRISTNWLLWSMDIRCRRHHQYILNADAVVVGTVKMWGQVIEHERGYRAQYARIASLDSIHTAPYLQEDAAEWLELLRKKHGVST